MYFWVQSSKPFFFVCVSLLIVDNLSLHSRVADYMWYVDIYFYTITFTGYLIQILEVCKVDQLQLLTWYGWKVEVIFLKVT